MSTRFARTADEEQTVISASHTLRLAKAAYTLLKNGQVPGGLQLVGLLIGYLKNGEAGEGVEEA